MKKNDPECRRELEKRCAGRTRAEVGRELNISDGTLYDALSGGVSAVTWNRIRAALGLPSKCDQRLTLHVRPVTHERFVRGAAGRSADAYLNYLLNKEGV